MKVSKDPSQLPVKIILNSFYGKFGQKVNNIIRNLFNPVLFCFITGFTRVQLYSFVNKHGLDKEVVSFATDSICITKNLNLNTKELGMFSLANSVDDVFILQNGFYRFNGIWKNHGFGKDAGKIVEYIDIKETDGRLYIMLQESRTTRLRTAILENRIRILEDFRPNQNKLISMLTGKGFGLLA